MKTYQNHLASLNNTKNYNLRRPVFRSSAIFPFLINSHLNAKIHFLGYWLIKRNIKEINILISIRDKSGKILKRFTKIINQVNAFTIDIKKELDIKKFSVFFGSIELEVFSTQDMVYPYPAFIINLDGTKTSSFVHTCGRIYNDYEDFQSNSKFLIPETGFDISNNKQFKPFFAFVNGKEALDNTIINLELINQTGQTKRKKIFFKKIKPYETHFVYFLHDKEKYFFLNKKGTVRIRHNFKNFFPRFLAGNFDKNYHNSSITHTYYDLSEKKDKSQYWLNPNKKKFCDMSIAIPILNHKNFFSELAVYPNFAKSKFNLNLQVYNQTGKNYFTIKDFLKVNKNFKQPKYVNLNELILKNKIILKKSESYFGKITISENKETLTRLKFGLNLGKYSKNNQAIESNICFNANVPVEAVLKKKGTFKWGLLKNRNNSFIILSNISFFKKNYKNANLTLKFWNQKSKKCLSKKIIIRDNGNYFFDLNKHTRIRNFLGKNMPGWITVQSDNPFVNGWYLEISKNGSIGADHLF